MKKIAVFAILFFFCSTAISSAAENESWIQKIKNKFRKKETAAAVKTAPAPVKEAGKSEALRKERKDRTKGELINDIIIDLDREEAILSIVPGLERKIGSDGKGYYAYQGTKLQDLDRNTLDNISGIVHSEALRLRTENISRQVEIIRRANAMTPAAPEIPRVPVSPVVNNPPQAPRPVQPQSKPPVPPPAPPRK